MMSSGMITGINGVGGTKGECDFSAQCLPTTHVGDHPHMTLYDIVDVLDFCPLQLTTDS